MGQQGPTTTNCSLAVSATKAPRVLSPVMIIACGAVMLLAGSMVASIGALKRPREGKLLVTQPEKTWQPDVEGKDGSFVPPDPALFVPFEIENTGRSPVRVRTIETTCGCISAKIEPSVVEPGGTAIVKVFPAAPPTGETTVGITLHTDSPLTPTVSLLLRSRGTMRPPYLLDVRGDLTFKGRSFTSESRDFDVYVVEPEGSSPRLPEIRSDLSFLTLSPLVLVQKGTYSGSNAAFRKYTCTVRFVREPPAPYVSGSVKILDPWHPDHVKELQATAEVLPRLRAAPSRIVITARSSTDWSASAELLVLSDESEPDLHFKVPDDSPLFVRHMATDPDAKRTVFSISLKPDGPIMEREHRLSVRSSSSSADEVTVPVHVLLEPSS